MIRTRIAILALLISGHLFADGISPELIHFGRTQAEHIAGRADVVAQVKVQNRHHATLSEQEILALDQRWREQYGKPDAPLIHSLMNTPLSESLRNLQLRSREWITEIIIMDNRGLNVAQSSVSSDYWQGDEAKWLNTFATGPDAEHVSPLGRDESTRSIQIQVSRTITDSTGQAIGAVTVGIAPAQF